MSRSFFGLAILLMAIATARGAESHSTMNVLIVTVDDMSADSLGVFGCTLGDTSPGIDSFARTAMRFEQAHVQVGNCMPGRNLMWSGMFAHRNGVEGFVQNTEPDYPVLCDLAKAAGYFTAIRGKVSHSTPYHPYPWDANLDTDQDGGRRHIKDAKSYGDATRQGIAMAADAGKPFCLMVNISDPHKPFYAQGKGGKTVPDDHVPSRVFTGDEVPVPGFLPDDDVIRKELAHYYSSVRRADDCFLAIMQALDDSGKADQTFVMFLSDHGMPLPFAKTQLYHHSTRTPLMVRWPGVTKPGTSDATHMVSAIDFLPTLLDVMGHTHPLPQRLQGRSFAPLLQGQTQSGRDAVVLQYNENAGRNRHPMRGLHTRRYLYLYNPWSNGKRKFATATTGTMTYRQMVKRAPAEAAIAARLDLFDHRVVEELYDIEADPDCLHNLAQASESQETLVALRKQLGESLQRLEDPVAPLLLDVENAPLRFSYMEAEDERSNRAKAKTRKGAAQRGTTKTQKGAGQGRARDSDSARQLLRDGIRLQVPKSVRAGASVTAVVAYRVPQALGTQKLHVTLKTAESRIDRKVVQVDGEGEVRVLFSVPENITEDTVRFAAFLGEDYAANLQHVNSGPVSVLSE